jgi:Transposase
MALRFAQAACGQIGGVQSGKNGLLKQGNKSDKLDARQLADRLRLNDLKSVYHGETGVRMLRELARSYLPVVKYLSRVMNRLKALYRSWAIPCAGRDVYYTRHRSQWLEKIPEAGTRRRAEQLYQQLDMLQHLRQQARGPCVSSPHRAHRCCRRFWLYPTKQVQSEEGTPILNGALSSIRRDVKEKR